MWISERSKIDLRAIAAAASSDLCDVSVAAMASFGDCVTVSMLIQRKGRRRCATILLGEGVTRTSGDWVQGRHCTVTGNAAGAKFLVGSWRKPFRGSRTNELGGLMTRGGNDMVTYQIILP